MVWFCLNLNMMVWDTWDNCGYGPHQSQAVFIILSIIYLFFNIYIYIMYSFIMKFLEEDSGGHLYGKIRIQPFGKQQYQPNCGVIILLFSLMILVFRHWPFPLLLSLYPTAPPLGWWGFLTLCDFQAMCSPY